MPSKLRHAKLLVFAAVVSGLAPCAKAQATIEPLEALSPPSRARLDAICQSAQVAGWATEKDGLRRAAREALASDKLVAAGAWLRAYRWAALFGQTHNQFIHAWVKAVNDAQVGHSNMVSEYEGGPHLLANSMSLECQSWVISRLEFSEDFFSLIQPVDFLPRVLEILSDLHRHDAQKFEEYANLALAIAVVYDLPPPPDWPHGQVSVAKLKRTWLEPVKIFDWLVAQDRQGRTQHSLRRLRADELKFVVDVSTPLRELEWAQSSISLPLSHLERAYSMVPYRKDRMTKAKSVWFEKDYALPTILAVGGICVDQAYFANAVGKARGVPTLYFRGVGDDGRHAWFGFLGQNQQWQLNAGRYAEQQYATGYARDPQTWSLITDHELRLLAERTMSSVSYRQSLLLTEFAEDFLLDGDLLPGSRAARRAVNYDRRNQRAWEILLDAEKNLEIAPKLREATMREAMLAFAHHPDLELIYSKRISESLRRRGESSAADFEERRIVRKYALDRADLSLKHAREALWRISGAHPTEQLIRNFDATLDRMGSGSGIAFFDEIVLPVVQHLVEQNRIADAERALERARRTLRVEPMGQLAQEFSSASEQLRAHSAKR